MLLSFLALPCFLSLLSRFHCQEMKTASVTSAEWDLTQAFMELFNAKDLVVYCMSSFPDADLMSKMYKDESSSVGGFQTALVNLPNNFDIPEHYYGSETPSVKLFLVDDPAADLADLSKLSMDERWTSVNVWLIRLPGMDTASKVADALRGLHLGYMSQVFTFTATEDGLVIREAYKISVEDEEVQVLEYGTWSSEKGLTVDPAHIWHRRTNLKGKHFRAASLYNKPYVTEVVPGCKDSSCFKGMFADVFHELQRIMNFTYEMHLPADGEWGQKREDGTWTGTVGQLIAGEVHIAPADFRITALRGPVIDYLPPLDEPHMRLFIANPAESFNWYAYVRPYTRYAWIAIAVAIVVFSLLVTFIISRGKPEPKKKDFSLYQSFAFVTGTILIKDWLATPWTLRSKIVFFSISFWGTLIYYHWEAMIISYLAVRTIALPFNSLEELVSETDFKIVLQGGTSFIDSFRYGNTPVLQKAWEERIKPYVDEFPLSKAGMAEKILDDKSFAMLDTYNVRIYHQDYITCQTVDVPKAYFPMMFAMPIIKGSPYFDAFWYHTNTLQERGSMEQIRERYRTDPQNCPEYSGKPLGFGQTFTAFVALIGGLSFGGLLLGMELLCRPTFLVIPSPLDNSKDSVDELLKELTEGEREIRKLEERGMQIKKKLARFKYNNG